MFVFYQLACTYGLLIGCYSLKSARKPMVLLLFPLEPELMDFEGDFRVNMYRRQEGEFDVNNKAPQTTQTPQTTQHEAAQFSEEDKKVLKLVYHNPAMTQKEYALELGWEVDRVKYYLRKMKAQQMISRVGSSHNGYWEVLINLSFQE